MDAGTAKDYIDDLLDECNKLRKDIDRLLRIINLAYGEYTDPTTGHLHGCPSGLVCRCGVMHYNSYKETRQ